ncbi:MAG: zinc metallopeptidase [bacterium]|nr:zinc metallopeptidase [bacterium]
MQDIFSEVFPGIEIGVAAAICIVAILIVIMTIVSFIVSVVLSIAYIRYNHKKNSLEMTGQEIARKILDENGLTQIKVSACGSLLFGNSYSHYFKKVRLRRFTYKKSSISSMVMATQKSALAIMDKENDPDMKKRNKLIPIVTFGPFAFIPLIIIGALLDVCVLKTNGTCTMICMILGVIFYLYSFLLSITILKTEKKAQVRALDVMKQESIANDQEIIMAQKLFRLYNIEYINNMILALLELIYYILRIVLIVMDSKNAVSKS